MVLARLRYVVPVEDSFSCICIVVSGFMLLLMVLYGVSFFLPFLDGSISYCPDLWMTLLDGYGQF